MLVQIFVLPIQNYSFLAILVAIAINCVYGPHAKIVWLKLIVKKGGEIGAGRGKTLG